MEKIFNDSSSLNGEQRKREMKGIPFISTSNAVVFLGKLFAKVERVVPSLSEKQNDFAFSSERFNYRVCSRFNQD